MYGQTEAAPRMARQGRDAFVIKLATSSFATSRERLAENPAIFMLRDSMLRDFASDGLGFTPDDAYAFSSWSGYLDPEDANSAWAQAKPPAPGQ